MTDVPGLDADDGPLTRWVIDAPLDDMEDARRHAGLDRNAVEAASDLRRPGWEHRGRLVFPSFFCPQPALWLRALAHLVLLDRPLQLLLEEVRPTADGEEILSMSRLYPRMDPDSLALLAEFSQAAAELQSDLGARVERAFALLRANAEHGLDIDELDDPEGIGDRGGGA